MRNTQGKHMSIARRRMAVCKVCMGRAIIKVMSFVMLVQQVTRRYH